MTHGPIGLQPDVATDWRAQAACSGYPNAVFFPSGDAPGHSADQALAVCSVCPVAEACLDYALETNQKAGIWGGTTEVERKSLRRKWLAGRRRSA